MPKRDKLLAWIEPHDGNYLASIVSGGAPGRRPATRVCTSAEDARRWVETRAGELDVPFEWVVDHTPGMTDG
jgi:hypothetical protein